MHAFALRPGKSTAAYSPQQGAQGNVSRLGAVGAPRMMKKGRNHYIRSMDAEYMVEGFDDTGASNTADQSWMNCATPVISTCHINCCIVQAPCSNSAAYLSECMCPRELLPFPPRVVGDHSPVPCS